MGRFLNKGNEKFERFSKSKYFVDKTEMINKLLEMDETEKFICNSRARRFGKSVTADMLVAYFSKGADSKELFEPLKCVKDELFIESMNHYDTIFVDIQAIFVEARRSKEEPNEYMDKSLVEELKTAYPEIVSDKDVPEKALSKIYQETGSQFVIIFDEWDYPIRELAPHNKERTDYVEFLRSLFKSSDANEYVRMTYLTGIMPIVRIKGQSAINNFREYTMIAPGNLGQYIGFTEDEVQILCEKFGIDFSQMKEWYNGYNMNGISIYNPWSVTQALRTDNYFTQYWTTTGTYEDIAVLINKKFDGLRETIIKMLSGSRIPVRVSSGKNDLCTFVDKDEVITALIHLGYFAYDRKTQEAYVPNKEIQEVFYQYMDNNEDDNLSQFMKTSEKILNAVMQGDMEETAGQIQRVHNDFISSIEYNDENSLSCTIMIALIAAFRYYHRPIREFPCGKGFADIVYLPLPNHPNRPVIIVELKWDKSAEAAISQMKERQYPESLEQYSGEVLLVGIDYDKRTKEHTCLIERLEKKMEQLDML